MNAKYPRTPHLPWSPGGTNDDKRLSSVDHLINVPVVVTEKLDGSNVCLTRDAVFARSHMGPPVHHSFDFLKSFHAQIRYMIPADISIFGEYCYAVHSIAYEVLPAYLFVFGVRDEKHNEWGSWMSVQQVAASLGLLTVPVHTEKTFKNAKELQAHIEYAMQSSSVFGGCCEGYVVRLSGPFTDPAKSIAKYVRADHVQTDVHWKNQTVIKQALKK